MDSSPSCSPLVFGNDVDSVDVAARTAMVRFLNSTNILANFTEHTRTLRLYPRPVVSLQHQSLLRSRPRSSVFTSQLCQSQAVEFYAEWLLVPSNLVYQRIHTGLVDPTVIGDKFKWFAHNLDPVSFIVWDNLSSLNTALKSLADNDTLATDESGSDSDGGGGSSSSSFSSLSELGVSKDKDKMQDLIEDNRECDLPSLDHVEPELEPPTSLQVSQLFISWLNWLMEQSRCWWMKMNDVKEQLPSLLTQLDYQHIEAEGFYYHSTSKYRLHIDCHVSIINRKLKLSSTVQQCP